MTNESRRAFEEWNKSEDKHLTHNRLIAWQASEGRILAMLESEEMVEIICKKMIGAPYKESKKNGDVNLGIMFSESFAKAAIEAIKQRINKGE